MARVPVDDRLNRPTAPVPAGPGRRRYPQDCAFRRSARSQQPQPEQRPHSTGRPAGSASWSTDHSAVMAAARASSWAGVGAPSSGSPGTTVMVTTGGTASRSASTGRGTRSGAYRWTSRSTDHSRRCSPRRHDVYRLVTAPPANLSSCVCATLSPDPGFSPCPVVARVAHHGFMRFILTVAGLVVAGVLAIWVIKAVIGVVIGLLSLIFWVAIAVLVVGGAIYLVGKARRAVTGEPRRRLPY